MFLHIISHHLKNQVIRQNCQRSGETISRHFHKVLNAVIHLQDQLFRKVEPIPSNSTDNWWKWFKVDYLSYYFLIAYTISEHIFLYMLNLFES